MIDDLIKLANDLDSQGLSKFADLVDQVVANEIEKSAKVKSKASPALLSSHPKVKDNKDHFPMKTQDQATKTLDKINQYDEAPAWFDGSVKDLLSIVRKHAKKLFPGIKLVEKSKKPGKK